MHVFPLDMYYRVSLSKYECIVCLILKVVCGNLKITRLTVNASDHRFVYGRLLQGLCASAAVTTAFHHSSHLCVMTRLSGWLKQASLWVILGVYLWRWMGSDKWEACKPCHHAAVFSHATLAEDSSVILTMSLQRLMETNSDKWLLQSRDSHSQAVHLCHNGWNTFSSSTISAFLFIVRCLTDINSHVVCEINTTKIKNVIRNKCFSF